MSKRFFRIISSLYLLFIVFQVGSFIILHQEHTPIKAADNTPSWKIPELQVSISGVKFQTPAQCGSSNGQKVYCVWWIKDLIQAYYGFAVGAVGILAAVGMMIGGFIWLTAGGSQQQVAKAKEWLRGSLIGLLLVMFTYTLLYTVNPDLINLRAVMVALVPKKEVSLDIPESLLNSMQFTSGGGVADSSWKATPEEVESIMRAKAEKYGIPYELLAALINQESQFNSKAVSKAGAMGLGQLMPGTAKGLGVTDPFNPDQNLDGAARYLRSCLEESNGNLHEALARYNWGGGNVQKKGMGARPAETIQHDSKITNYYKLNLEKSGQSNQTITTSKGKKMQIIY